MEGKNPFYEKIKTYLDKRVIVHLKTGAKLEGNLVSVNFVTMNFILEGRDEDYIIRDDVSYIAIWRKQK